MLLSAEHFSHTANPSLYQINHSPSCSAISDFEISIKLLLEINNLIENSIQGAEKVANSLPSSKGKIEDLNSFFIKNLR